MYSARPAWNIATSLVAWLRLGCLGFALFLHFCDAIVVELLLLLRRHLGDELVLLCLGLELLVLLILLLEIELGRLLIFCDRGDVLARNFPRGPFHDEIERRGQDDSLCLGIGRPLDEVGGVLAIEGKPIHRQNGNGFGGAKAAPGEHFLPSLLSTFRRSYPQIQIRADAFATLNGRPSQRMIDPKVNLAAQVPGGWILPLAD